MKILHICESYGGGVTSAINTYVNNSPHAEHYLLATTRDNDLTGEERKGGFKEILLLPRKLNSIIRLRKEYNRIKPDYVHLHSSFAGVVVRLLHFIPKEKIIYTPHGFAFCREDNFIAKSIYILIEFILKYKTAVIAGCSRNEVNLSIKTLRMKNTHEIINICEPFSLKIDTSRLNNPIPTVGMVGRISNQKGFQFYAEVAEHFKGKAQFIWIGGGDSDKENILKDAGVLITGWGERKGVLEQLANLDLYFHTAAWEGFPISVLEAVVYDKPVLLRSIGPFVDEDLFCINTTAEGIQFINGFINDDLRSVQIATDTSLKIKNYHTELNLQKSLKELYK